MNFQMFRLDELPDVQAAFDCVDHNTLWKILKEMGIPDHLICLLRNLYAGQQATIRTEHGTTDWFQIGKGVHHGCILSPCLFNLYAENIMRNTGMDEAQVGIKIARRNSSTGIPSPPLGLFVVMLPKARLTSHSRMSGCTHYPIPLGQVLALKSNHCHHH